MTHIWESLTYEAGLEQNTNRDQASQVMPSDMTLTISFSFMGNFENFGGQLDAAHKVRQLVAMTLEFKKTLLAQIIPKMAREKNFLICLNEVGQKNNHPPGKSAKAPTEDCDNKKIYISEQLHSTCRGIPWP